MAIYLNPLKKMLGLPQHYVTEIREDYQYVRKYILIFIFRIWWFREMVYFKKNLSKALALYD